MEDNSSLDFSTMLQNAMADPRFGEILSTLKDKSDKGEIDLEQLKKSVLTGVKKEEETEKKGYGSDLFHKMDKHKRLLCALAPYLSDSKQEAVNGILKISSIGEIAEKLGTLGTGRKE